MEELSQALEEQGYRVRDHEVEGRSLLTAVREREEGYEVGVYCHWTSLTLHWGIGIQRSKEWVNPNSVLGYEPPPGTTKMDAKASQSQLTE